MLEVGFQVERTNKENEIVSNGNRKGRSFIRLKLNQYDLKNEAEMK